MTVSCAEPGPLPQEAVELFANHAAGLERYARLLATTGVEHGLIGPREVPRLWERHLLNCALVSELIPKQACLIDVGTGAGLPGLVLALVRPDLQVQLVEPLQRRVRWLETAIDELGLTSTTVHRGRAEEFWGHLRGDIVTARAVARLAELTAWCLPLVAPGGQLMAIKGASAARELAEDLPRMRAAGASDAEVLTCSGAGADVPTTVVRVTPGRQRSGDRRRRGAPRRGSQRRGPGAHR